MLVGYAVGTPLAISEPMPRLNYRADIDGLRAIAVLAVIGFHVSPQHLSGGYAGVDIFFVISGYVISGIIFRALTKRTLRYFDFYARRAKRIFPALTTVLLTAMGIGWLLLMSDEYEILGKNIATGAAFLSNVSLYNDFEWYFGFGTNPLLHLWSLGVEEQFYLLWPLFLVATWRFTKARLAAIVLMSIVSFSLNIVASHTDPSGCFYLPWNRLWELSAGAALAYTAEYSGSLNRVQRALDYPGWPPVLSLLLRSRGVLGFTLVALSIVGLKDGVVYPGWWALLPCIGTLLVISAGPDGWVNRVVLARRPVVFVGLLSYSLYLWHWPLLAFGHIGLGSRFTTAVAAGLAVLAVLLAFLTYRYIESPIRHARSSRQVVSALCLALLIPGVLGVLAASGSIGPRLETHAVERYVRAAREDWLPTAHGIPGARTMRAAHWTVWLDGLVAVGSAERQVLFMGDSNMQQYYPRIVKVLSEHPGNSHGAVFAVGSGCAPAVMEMMQTRAPDVVLDPCRRTVQRGMDYAGNPRVDRVVISALWHLYLVDLTQGGKVSTDAVLNDLREMIAKFTKRGKRVYLVLNIPIGDDLDPRKMIRRTLSSPGYAIDVRSPTKSKIMEVVGPIGAKLRQVAESAGAIVIDPVEFLCNTTTCPALTSTGEPMYKDATHLRPSYVRDNVLFLDGTILDTEFKTVANELSRQ